VACVYQETAPAAQPDGRTKTSSSAANRRATGLRDVRRMEAHAARLLQEYGLQARSGRPGARPSRHPDRQMIEIIANLDRQASYLMLDEPDPPRSTDGRPKTCCAKVRQIRDRQEDRRGAGSRTSSMRCCRCAIGPRCCWGGHVLFTDAAARRAHQAAHRRRHRRRGVRAKRSPIARSARRKRSTGRRARPCWPVDGPVQPATARGSRCRPRAGEIVGIYGAGPARAARAFLRTLFTASSTAAAATSGCAGAPFSAERHPIAAMGARRRRPS